MGNSLRHFTKIKTEHVNGAVTGNLPSLYKVKNGKNTVIEDVKDEIDKFPDSDYAKAAARVVDEIDHR